MDEDRAVPHVILEVVEQTLPDEDDQAFVVWTSHVGNHVDTTNWIISCKALEALDLGMCNIKSRVPRPIVYDNTMHQNRTLEDMLCTLCDKHGKELAAGRGFPAAFAARKFVCIVSYN